METKVRAHVIVYGRVQGVFFRLEAQTAAVGIGVCGWVRNCSNGTVEAVFEGERSCVNAAVEWCHRGSPLSTVDHVDVTWQTYTGEFDGFKVAY